MPTIFGLLALTAATILLAACQTQQGAKGSARATGPTLGDMLEQSAMAPAAAQMKPGETLLGQTTEGWKVIYADIRSPGKSPFRYCMMDWSAGPRGGVALQVSQDNGLRVILETPNRSFRQDAPIFPGMVRFANGVRLQQRFQAVGEHVAWIPPGTVEPTVLLRHLAASSSVSFNDARGTMLEAPTRTAGEAIKLFNQCTLNRL